MDTRARGQRYLLGIGIAMASCIALRHAFKHKPAKRGGGAPFAAS